ncbi:MAG: PKD domain-containing protein [Aquaticitalea sp.]
MKILKYVSSICLLVLAIYGCSQDDSIVNIGQIAAPTNVSATVRVTQDNSGLVTITPLGEGVTNFNLTFGDNSEPSDAIQPGQSVNHVYEEGTYEMSIKANGLNGLSTVVTQTVVVSFQAPQNLVVSITNDPTISKKVNVTAEAEFAMSYEVDFGESGGTLVEGNIGETVSFVYQEPGTYTITVTAFSAAIETSTYTEEFIVTAILQPLQAAPTPPARADNNVISIFSDAYTDIAGTDYYPNWGQSTTYNQITVDGSAIIQYGNLNYEGIQLGTPANASSMEFLHVDVWTADDNDAKISPISSGPNETAFDLDLIPQQWTSFNIPISFFTDQNPLVNFADIIQFKFDGVPAGGTIFVDNLYFYRAATGTTTSLIEDFEGTPPSFTSFGNIPDAQVIANPDPSGINTSSNVAELSKVNGALDYAGSFFLPANPIDLVSFDKISLKTWSPKVGVTVKLKLENQAGDVVYEVDNTTTVSNTWENLVFDFSGAPAANYVRIVIFFDFGNVGDGSVYYFDDIQLVSEEGGISSLDFQDFEGSPPVFVSFGNIPDAQVIDNPDPSGINTTSKVGEFSKVNGALDYAGTFFEVSTALDFASYSKISVKTWSPKLGAIIKVKLENQDGSITYEFDKLTTVTNQWEELQFDFSGAPAANYIRIVIFFDFGNVGDNSVYYFDQFALTN